MADLPSVGDPNWGSSLNAFLGVEHNSDGTHNLPDNTFTHIIADVDGEETNVYIKYFTGTLDNDSTTVFAHGVADGLTKILSATFALKETADIYRAGEMYRGTSSTVSAELKFDNTNISIANVGTDFQGNPYRVRIDYIL